jgi:hypothetical protein
MAQKGSAVSILVRTAIQFLGRLLTAFVGIHFHTTTKPCGLLACRAMILAATRSHDFR